MISEDAVTLNPRMPLLISLRSVITVFDCSGTVLFSAAQVFLNASNVPYFCFKIPVPLPQSGKYLTGWVCQDGRWWYLLSGYTYWHDAVCQIDGQAYAFDSDGWMITADRIAEDGHIR